MTKFTDGKQIATIEMIDNSTAALGSMSFSRSAA